MAPGGPPPSQAGKFKPRKAPKKIRAGVTAVPDAVNSNQTAARAPEPVPSSARHHAARRPRAPMPQGQVFFTGQATPSKSKPSKASAASASKGKSASTASSPPTQQGAAIRVKTESNTTRIVVDEEVIATLEEGIGSQYRMDSKKKAAPTADGKKKSKKSPVSEKPIDLTEEDPPNHVLNDMYYDSDSSENDEEEAVNGPAPRLADEPVNLPFQDHRTSSKLFDTEDDSWVLFHLPSRLPQVIQQAKVKEEQGENEVKNVSTMLSPVATPNLEPNSFDDCLSNAVSGKVGKLKIYKSGKAVLVLEGTEVSEKSALWLSRCF